MDTDLNKLWLPWKEGANKIKINRNPYMKNIANDLYGTNEPTKEGDYLIVDSFFGNLLLIFIHFLI